MNISMVKNATKPRLVSCLVCSQHTEEQLPAITVSSCVGCLVLFLFSPPLLLKTLFRLFHVRKLDTLYFTITHETSAAAAADLTSLSFSLDYRWSDWYLTGVDMHGNVYDVDVSKHIKLISGEEVIFSASSKHGGHRTRTYGRAGQWRKSAATQPCMTSRQAAIYVTADSHLSTAAKHYSKWEFKE